MKTHTLPVVLVTGATGYVGGRLIDALDPDRFTIRCMVRDPRRLHDRGRGVEIVPGDALDPESLKPALAGVDTAFYMIHSMGGGGDFAEADRVAACNFAAIARASGVRRIIYLGGLGDSREELSPHLQSRQEVGDILRTSGSTVIELRASIIIGSGSLSFDLIRALTERLPMMITPRWVSVPAQPIAIDDVISYLTAALESDINDSTVVEIGGRDVVTYGGLMREYARQRGLRRLWIPVPVITPRLSSLWLHLVTPLHSRVGRKLIDGVRHSTVVRDDRARRLFPVAPVGIAEAISTALRNGDREFADTRWSGALSSLGDAKRWEGARFGNRLVDTRTIHIEHSAEEVFRALNRIGGETGWYYADALWTLRGRIDRMVGGVGMRRGRRDPETLRVGDVVDCWRCDAVVPNRMLRLSAEMKIPGRAWLQFEVVPSQNGDGAHLTQSALFDPVGLFGIVYWYMLYPVHQLVFSGMARGIARAAKTAA